MLDYSNANRLFIFTIMGPFVIMTFFHCDPCRAQVAGQPWEANPELVQRLMNSQDEFNYDESRVPQYSLPDALRFNDGTPVTSAAQWNRERRSELMEVFRRQVYGRRPEATGRVEFELLKKIEDMFDGQATGLSMKATVTIERRQFEFPFVVIIPNLRQSRSPAILLINNRYFTPLEKAATEEDDFWPVKLLISRGYATASFHTSDVDPDRADGYAQGIRSFFANGEAPADDAWRSLSAWGWAASRVLDFLEEVDAIDASRVAVVGHSRGGKSALWAACEDTRFALSYSNNSGCGGAALFRRNFGETIGRITRVFPHWFSPELSTYAGREVELAFDQHQLIGLIAPRGVYITSADEDLWADPKGEYASLVAAAPVFELLGQKSIVQSAMPPLNVPRHRGQTGYHIRSGGHGLEAADWTHFLDFADRLLITQD